MKTIPNYHPPSDYRRPTKTQEKIYVPVNDYPEINFSILTPLLTILLLPSQLQKWLSAIFNIPKTSPAVLLARCLTLLT
jgi:hypothetical protein